MSGPMKGSMDESPAVIFLRHRGNLEDAIAALKALDGHVALDEPAVLSEVAALKAENAGLKAEVARLTEEINVLKGYDPQILRVWSP
jgi:cell division protein FtsB